MKTLKIAALAAGVLLLAGCGNKVAQNSTNTGAEKIETPKTEEKNAVNDVITSMKDAMLAGKTMKCDYTIKDADGKELTTTSYVNGKKYMTTMAIAGNVQHMIFDETAMYTWAEGQKQGTKMTLACTQDLAKNMPAKTDAAAPTPDPTGEKTFDSATNVSCKPDSSADFSVPTDVTFTDQCEMIKNSLKNIPTGAPQL